MADSEEVVQSSGFFGPGLKVLLFVLLVFGSFFGLLIYRFFAEGKHLEGNKKVRSKKKEAKLRAKNRFSVE